MKKLISTSFVMGSLAFTVLLGGCNVSPEVAVSKGKDMVAGQLKDPDSAQFQSVVFYEKSKDGVWHHGNLCGEVNSKNSFGGYSGFKRFKAEFSYSTDRKFEMSGLRIDDSAHDEAFFNILWDEKCTYPKTDKP